MLNRILSTNEFATQDICIYNINTRATNYPIADNFAYLLMRSFLPSILNAMSRVLRGKTEA